MAHGQWWPNAKRRFFHKDHIDIRVEMHGGFHAAPGAREIMLPLDRDCCLWHFSYHDIADLVWKSQRYTTVQAWQRARSGRRPGPAPLVHRGCPPGVEGVRQRASVARRSAGCRDVGGPRLRPVPRPGQAMGRPRVDERAAEYQRMKEAMLGLAHDPDLAPIDTSERELLARAPKAVGEVEF